MNKNNTVNKFPFFSSELIHGWSVSVLLHATLVLILVFWIPMASMVLEQVPFRWEVSLVNSSSNETRQMVQAVAEVGSSALSSMTSSSEPTSYERQKSQMIPPAVKQTKSQPSPSPRSTQRVEEKPISQELQTARLPEPTQPEPAMTEIAKQEVIKESVPATTSVTESIAPTDIPQHPAPVVPESAATSSDPVDIPTAETASTTSNSTQASGVKANHRWVGESLWRRVTELKRYPRAARLNRMEGEVIVRAVIEANGNLMEVQIRKSSGNDHLDEAALDVVRQACPLHMKHELEVAQVVVDLPISYSLKR